MAIKTVCVCVCLQCQLCLVLVVVHKTLTLETGTDVTHTEESKVLGVSHTPTRGAGSGVRPKCSQLYQDLPVYAHPLTYRNEIQHLGTNRNQPI